MREMWKDIPGYEGIYQASTLGKIRRIDGKNGKYFIDSKKNFVLKGEIAHNGYLRYYLCNKDMVKKHYFGHRLVMMAFSKETGQCINHKNGDKLDNRICNLEWCSFTYNAWHSRNILKKKPEKKFSKKVVAVETGEVYESIHDAARKVGAQATNICKALKGKTKTCRGYHWEYFHEQEKKLTK